MTAYTITKNEQFNSIEISFDGKPSEAVRDSLKALRFRWHGVKKIWYGYTTEETARAAIEGKTETKTEKTPKTDKANKFGVKVGDLFRAPWGYEQTNVDFFQVIELVGESSVRVREVYPEMIEDKAVGPMASDRTYRTNTNGKLLPKAVSSVFIKDQDKGDIKRLRSSDKDGISNPFFKLDSFAWARLCGETAKGYESWYA